MKVILNKCYGGFGIKDEIISSLVDKGLLSCDIDFYDADDVRYNTHLISMIEDGIDCGDEYSELTVFTLPDDATDHMIEEYDGMETIYYVVDGKIYAA